jgi:hypothetical protein
MAEIVPYPGTGSPYRQPVVEIHHNLAASADFDPVRHVGLMFVWDPSRAATEGRVGSIEADRNSQLQGLLGGNARIQASRGITLPMIGNAQITRAQVPVEDYNNYLTLLDRWATQQANGMGNEVAVEWVVPGGTPIPEIDLRGDTAGREPTVVLDLPTAKDILGGLCNQATRAYQGLVFSRDQVDIAEVRRSPGYPELPY